MGCSYKYVSVDYIRIFIHNENMSTNQLRTAISAAFMAILLSALILSSCSFFPGEKNRDSDELAVNIVIEDNENLILSQNIFNTSYNNDVTLSLKIKEGYKITGCDYKDYSIKKTSDIYEITLFNIKYSTVVSIQTAKSDIQIKYELNSPTDEKTSQTFTEYPDATHIKLNTAIYSDDYFINGYTLTGWNTAPNQSGADICLGGRIGFDSGENSKVLYGSYVKWTDAALFTYEENNGFITITGYNPENINLIQEKKLVVPQKIGGKSVTYVSDNAFDGFKADIDVLVLPPCLKTVGKAAFKNCTFSEIILYDSLENVSDYSFEGCNNLRTLRINAATKPVYCGTYYATFPDKIDYLESIKKHFPDNRTLVLFSGSSTRFGYDSPMLEQAFQDIKVANMGVFAYTNAMPQMDLILSYMQEGDILLDSPEFDASRRQFCVLNKFDDKFFNLIEENYCLMEKLDLRDYTGVFSAFNEYLLVRRGMEKRSYDLSPSDYDENFNKIAQKSYNAHGDYILFRPNATDDAPVFDLPVDYLVSAFPESYVDSLNRQAQKFTDKGITFLFTYAPRNIQAISSESTYEKRMELDNYFKESFSFPVISDIEDSLYEGRYLFETDNHLSTEGAQIRTKRIIEELKPFLQ